MTELHFYVAYSVPAGFFLLFLWAVVAFVRNRAPGGPFWSLLALLQVVLGLQAVTGAALFFAGARPSGAGGPTWLHYVYGFFFPALVLVFAHRVARSERFEEIAWLPFGVAAFLVAASTLRALQTGTG